MANTVLLNPRTWDLMLDASRSIAMASEPYALAQDVASACKLFNGELWYNTNKGIPYFQRILGYRPPMSLLKDEFQKAALSVPNVVQASAQFSPVTGERRLTGQLNFTDQNGITSGIKL